MALQPIGFSGRTVRAKDHGAAFAALMTDGRVAGCAIAYSSGSVSLASGWLVAAGRLIHNNATLSTAISATSGFVQLVLVVDITGTGSTTIVQRTASTENGFASLSQGDINGGSATVYEVELCVLNMNTGALVRSLGMAARPIYITTAAPTSSSPDGIYLVTG